MKIGVALGSGSARGWSHIGVLEALEELNVPISYIVGTSIGAYVGFIYAAGDLKRLKKFALQLDKRQIIAHLDLKFPRSGFIEGKRFPELIYAATDARRFDELKIPFACVATDILTGREVIFDEGDAIMAIRASVSVPGVLTPVRYKKHILVDGGVVNPVPVNIIRQLGADKIIAVDLNAGILKKRFSKSTNKEKEDEKIIKPTEMKNSIMAKFSKTFSMAEKNVKEKWNTWFNNDNITPNIFDVYGSTIDIMETQITRINLDIYQPDILIQPNLGDLWLFDFDQAGRSIAEGYAKTMEQKDKILTLIR